MSNNLITKVAAGTNIDYWENKKIGKFEDLNNDYNLRFIEMVSYTNQKYPSYEWEKLPIVAKGFIVFLIKNWGKNTSEIFMEYRNFKLKEYIKLHSNDYDAWKRNLEKEFSEFHKSEEEKKINDSKQFYEFIGIEESNLLDKYITNYLEFISNKQKENIHFTRIFTENGLETLYQKLTTNTPPYIDLSTDYDFFCFALSGKNIPKSTEKQVSKINWNGSSVLLAYFINNLFGDTDSNKIWKLTCELFTVKNKTPNINHLKNAVSKYINNYSEKPKGFELIDKILQDI